jgi:RES domain-containing protein
VPKRRRPEPPRRGATPGAGDAAGPSLLELDRFNTASVRRWLLAADRLRSLQTALYFGLEGVRQAKSASLVAALRFAAGGGLDVDGWCRIVDYRYSLAPLSVAGSLKVGGRFNIGVDLDPASFTPFPALYIADGYATALREKFGQVAPGTPLTPDELALRRPGSFTHVRLRGRIERVLDVTDTTALQGFVDVIREFALPRTVATLARQLNLKRAPALIRSAVMLQRQLLSPDWRMLPMQYDLPANSQVFGRVASAAGLHGILYPSARAEQGRCLALFPQNWRGSDTYVEVADVTPPEARLVRLDGTSEGLV